MELSPSLFPSNFFFRQYFYLVNRFTKNPYDGPDKNRHHVYPKSIFGKTNYIILISFRNHLIVHYLLYRGCQVSLGDKHDWTKKMANVLRFSVYGLYEKFGEDKKFKESLSVLLEKARNKVYYSPWNKGIPRTAEQRENHSKLMKGKRAWNRGIKIGVVTAGAYKKGNIPWNKGIPFSEETKQKMRKPKIEGSGKMMSEGKRKVKEALTPEEREKRKQIRSEIAKRFWNDPVQRARMEKIRKTQKKRQPNNQSPPESSDPPNQAEE